MSNKWTSLQKAQFSLSVFSAISSAALAVLLFYFGNKIQDSKLINQTVLSKKIELYDSMMPNLNSIFCYMEMVGDYNEHTPVDIIGFKRDVQKAYYTNKYFFDSELQAEYNNFMNLCFKNRSGEWDSPIRNRLDSVKVGYMETNPDAEWRDTWDDMFTEETPQKKKIKDSYYRFMRLFMVELGIEASGD